MNNNEAVVAEEEEIDDVEDDVDDDEEEEEVGMPFTVPGGTTTPQGAAGPEGARHHLVDKQQRQQTHMAGKRGERQIECDALY